MAPSAERSPPRSSLAPLTTQPGPWLPRPSRSSSPTSDRRSWPNPPLSECLGTYARCRRAGQADSDTSARTVITADKKDVTPPVVLYALRAADVPREAPEPPDHEAALRSAPGGRIDGRLATREVREVRPVVGIGDDGVVAVVLVMAVGVGREVNVASMLSRRRVDLGVREVRLGRAGEVLGVAAACSVEPVPKPEADPGLDECLGPVPQIVEHLRHGPFVVEAHDRE